MVSTLVSPTYPLLITRFKKFLSLRGKTSTVILVREFQNTAVLSKPTKLDFYFSFFFFLISNLKKLFIFSFFHLVHLFCSSCSDWAEVRRM